MSCGSIALEVDLYYGGHVQMLTADIVEFYWKFCYLLA